MHNRGNVLQKLFIHLSILTTTSVKSTKKVLINSESIKYDVIPAQYTWYEEEVKVSDGTEKIVTTPAVYKTIYERILVEPAIKSWRRDLSENSPKAFNSCVESAFKGGMDIVNAEVGTCFYEHYHPEKYITTTSKILATEASEQIIVTSAKYRTTSKKIMTDSTSVKLLPSVAVYKKVKDNIGKHQVKYTNPILSNLS